MELREYLEKHELTYAEFGRRIGVAGWSVKRYAEGGRVPTPEVMRAILMATEGKVAPNDFFGEAA